MAIRRMLLVVSVFANTAPAAQQSSPAFEVASIRRNISGAPPNIEFQPSRFVATTIPLRWLAAAYGKEGREFDIQRLIGGPS